MAYIDWKISGPKIGVCSCDYGCPCEFNGKPSRDVCEGGGWAQGIIDKRATDEQVDALFKILGGEEQEPTTVFNIYGSTMDGEDDPIFADLKFEADIEARTGKLVVDGKTMLNINPIKNPVTGKPHRARIVLPEGFEFREAEMGSGDVTIDAGLKMQYESVYGVLWHASYGPHGVIENAA